jgi:hypothetical protein
MESRVTTLLYAFSVQTFVDMLTDLSGVLDKGVAHVKAKQLDPESLLTARLAPDMFTLIQQVQVATFQAKVSVAYLAGKEPPPFEGNEKTFDDLKFQIQKTIDYVKSVPESALEGGEARAISWPLPGDIAFEGTGLQLLKDWALPHFYFHVTTAYDILRHKGVQIGKFDYLAHIGPLIRQKAK